MVWDVSLHRLSYMLDPNKTFILINTFYLNKDEIHLTIGDLLCDSAKVNGLQVPGLIFLFKI